MFRKTLVLFLCTVPLVSIIALDQPTTPEPILPDTFKWGGPPHIPELRGAWVLGTEKQEGTYALRVKLAKGGKIPAHTHPDTRYSTVMSGTLYVGFGDKEDESKFVAIQSGGLYVAPANVPHYLWAKDDDVVYQEGGVGPTATTFIK